MEERGRDGREEDRFEEEEEEEEEGELQEGGPNLDREVNDADIQSALHGK